jgi:hypothetical protein
MVISLLMESDAKQVQGVSVLRLGVEDAAIPPDRLGQQSALVFLQAEGQLVVHGDALSIFKGGTRKYGTHRLRGEGSNRSATRTTAVRAADRNTNAGGGDRSNFGRVRSCSGRTMVKTRSLPYVRTCCQVGQYSVTSISMC